MSANYGAVASVTKAFLDPYDTGFNHVKGHVSRTMRRAPWSNWWSQSAMTVKHGSWNPKWFILNAWGDILNAKTRKFHFVLAQSKAEVLKVMIVAIHANWFCYGNLELETSKTYLCLHILSSMLRLIALTMSEETAHLDRTFFTGCVSHAISLCPYSTPRITVASSYANMALNHAGMRAVCMHVRTYARTTRRMNAGNSWCRSIIRTGAHYAYKSDGDV